MKVSVITATTGPRRSIRNSRTKQGASTSNCTTKLRRTASIAYSVDLCVRCALQSENITLAHTGKEKDLERGGAHSVRPLSRFIGGNNQFIFCISENYCIFVLSFLPVICCPSKEIEI